MTSTVSESLALISKQFGGRLNDLWFELMTIERAKA